MDGLATVRSESIKAARSVSDALGVWAILIAAMNRPIRKLHIYTGLLNFSIFVLFGLAGLVVTFDAPGYLSLG